MTIFSLRMMSLESYPIANHVNLGAVDQHFGGARTAVVVRRHHEAVSTGTHHGNKIARIERRQVAFAREEIAALAYRADDISGLAIGARPRATGTMS